jgi:hypothetical protein
MANYMGDFNRFRPIVQKVLPLVYDESLSYYEILCKIVYWIEHNKESYEELIDEKIAGLTSLNDSLVRKYEDLVYPTKAGYTICTYNDKIYRCRVVIDDPEEFKPSKWEEIILADAYSDTTSELFDIVNALADAMPELPEITAEDAGKMLVVDENGEWALETPYRPTGTLQITRNEIVDVGNFRYADVNVPTGGVSGTINIYENGNVDVSQYETAHVDVPASAVDSGEKEIHVNGDIDVVGYAIAKVRVPASAVDAGTVQITQNGVTNIVGYAFANVEVPGGGITPTGTITLDDNGYYDVTQYAHASVDVPASAVVSGTKSITQNGTEDVTNYANVNVNVPASAVDVGTKSIVTNGTHSVVGFANANVAVPASAVDSGTKTILLNGTHDVVGYANVSVAVPSGSAQITGSVTLNITQNVLSDREVFIAYKKADTVTQNVVTFGVQELGTETPPVWTGITVPLVAAVEQIRDGFYLFTNDDAWIDSVSGGVYMACSSFNPLTLDDYGIGDDFNVYYIIPTASTVNVTITDGEAE